VVGYFVLLGFLVDLLFGEISLVRDYLVIESILNKFCWVFFPLRFPRINACVLCDYLSFNKILIMLLL
jgi:hypothetical protein